MSGAADPVLGELLAISPGGAALPPDPASFWGAFLAPVAAEIGRFKGMAQEQATEVDPRAADYLLADYERVLGADPCGRDAQPLTVAQRQQLAYQRWTARGGQSVAYFEGLAAALGVSITINEFVTFAAGRSTAGQALINTPQQFCWQVVVPATEVTLFRAGTSGAGDLLGAFTPSPAVCVIEDAAPAHTLPVFSYTGPAIVQVGGEWLLEDSDGYFLLQDGEGYFGGLAN